MGKGNKNRSKNRDDASANSGNKKVGTTNSSTNTGDNNATSRDTTTTTTTTASATATITTSSSGIFSLTSSSRRRSLYQWCISERQGIMWGIGCITCGILLGFGIGSGWLVGEWNNPPNPWRISLGGQIRSTPTYTLLSESVTTLLHDWIGLWPDDDYSSWRAYQQRRNVQSVAVHDTDWDVLMSNPSHPYIFAVLREAVIRVSGGYVHPDLGLLQPAPCGAARGLGMVRDTYHKCQIKCLPGLAHEKLDAMIEYAQRDHSSDDDYDDGDCDGEWYQCGVSGSNSHYTNNKERTESYMQEEVLLLVPLDCQMTRKVALDTLLPLVSVEVQRKASIHELDDAALLTLLLAHERGVGQYSPWFPYIISLPLEPSCGYSLNLRPHLLDSINAMRDELGMDVGGWPTELMKATRYAHKIATSLTKDYGSFIEHPDDVTPLENIQWALCHVASRAIGGSQKFGALRMVPIVDMINHDFDAGGMVELTGHEKLSEGDFVEALQEGDEGAFVVRSIRHGRRKALRVGQELLVNYNVPHYSALDWFVSSGFVPPERFGEWQKLDAPLSRLRRDGPFARLFDTSNRPYFPNGGNPSD